MEVCVVVNLELGWDNIVGVFDPYEVSRTELEERFPKKNQYYVFHKVVETNLDDYE